ncbi:MAG: hypothetical protein AAB781_01090 [Patescibacteria group bacterium]
MFKNFELKKIAVKFFGNGYKSAEAEEINPRRDWNIILAVFALIVFVITAFGLYLHGKINSGSFFTTSRGNELPVETINRSELKKIIGFYAAKNQSFQEARTNKQEVVDPSL